MTGRFFRPALVDSLGRPYFSTLDVEGPLRYYARPIVREKKMARTALDRHSLFCAYLVVSALLLVSCGSGPSSTSTPPTTPPQTNCSNAATGSPTDYSTSPMISGCAVFPTDNPWNADVSNYCVDPNSDQYIASINVISSTCIRILARIRRAGSLTS